MSYQKPTLIAVNYPTGSYSAGCPANLPGGPQTCRNCDRAQ